MSDADLHDRLGRLHRATARRWMVEFLRSGELGLAHVSLFAALFQFIEVGESWHELLDIALDTEAAPFQRAAAAAVLSVDAPAGLGDRLSALDPPLVQALTEASLLHLLIRIDQEPEHAQLVATTLSNASHEGGQQLISKLERARDTLRLPAGMVYEQALARTGPGPVLDGILEVVSDEGSREGARILEEQRQEATDDAKRRALQRALLVLRTGALESPQPQRLEGYAMLGTCDGQGTFSLIGAVARTEDAWTVLELRIRAGGEVRDGISIPHASREELDELTRDTAAETGCPLVSISLLDGARIAVAAADRTAETGLTVPEDARPCVRWFEHALPVIDAGGSQLPSAGDVDREELLRVVDSSPMGDTWFFDAGDLLSAGVELPEDDGSALEPAERSEWAQHALRYLNTEPFRTRLHDMARHMAAWCAFAGREAQALLFASAAEEVQRDLPGSALGWIMAQRARLRAHRVDFQGAMLVAAADDRLRAYIRGHVFTAVKQPRGRTLAALDFTAAAYVALDLASLSLRSDRRPRDQERLLVAGAIGPHFARIAIRHELMDSELADDARQTFERDFGKLVSQHLSLDRDETATLVSLTTGALLRHVSELCQICPVRCLQAPSRGASQSFFADHHPALGPASVEE